MNASKFWRFIGSELRQVLSGRDFWLSVLAVVCLGLFNPVAVIGNGKEVNAWYIMTAMRQEEQSVYLMNVCFSAIVRNVTSGYFIMFAPLLTGAAVIPLLCEERESGMLRVTLFRCGKKQMTAGRLIAVLCSGGLVLALGYLLFCALIYFFVPQGEDMEAMQNLFLLMRVPWLQACPVLLQSTVIWLQRVVGVFLYGAVSVGWTYLLSIVVRNRYLIACIPFMLVDFMQKRLEAASMANELQGGLELWDRYLHPVNVLEVGWEPAQSAVILGIYVCMWAFFGWLSFRALERKVDCGQ